MNKKLPGTTIEAEMKESGEAKRILNGIFSVDGLMLSQVSQLIGVEPHTVQNWIKRGFCSPPVAKRYSKRQFCRIVIINMLKDCLSLAEITNMLSYINGLLNDESDDMIPDDELYFYFSDAIVRMGSSNISEAKESVERAISDYTEPFSGGKQKLSGVLSVMTFAYYSSVMRNESLTLLSQIKI